MRFNANTLKIAIGFISLMAFSFCFADALPLSHIHTLAASCAACHGSAGNPVQNAENKNAENPSKIFPLAGMNAEQFIKQMQDFKSGARAATVMHHHAKGLNAQEIEQLAVFFSSQKIKNIQALSTQVYVSPRDTDAFAK